MSTTVDTDVDIRPFHLEIPEEELADLRRRIAATRWPTEELVDDRSQGVQLAALQALARYWTSDYDWRKAEAKLNALSQFTTEIEGVDIHFIHVKSEQENALPLIMTHGWPGSVIEMLDSVGPLTDPTAYGGSAEDAFHLVLPSLPGYGLSPARLSPGPGRLDDRPRHGRLLQDRARVRRRAALGQPHARPHPGQRHAVLADRDRRLCGSVVLGGLRARRPGRGPSATGAAG